jgi:hypothetical protein
MSLHMESSLRQRGKFTQCFTPSGFSELVGPGIGTGLLAPQSLTVLLDKDFQPEPRNPVLHLIHESKGQENV